jgi:NHL repeat
MFSIAERLLRSTAIFDRLPPCASAVGAALLVLLMTLSASPAEASLGYEPDESTPSIALQGEIPHGVAIDQASQRIYVAMVTRSLASLLPGQIDQLESTGVATTASPFTATGPEAIFSGVAVNPLTKGIYAAQFIWPITPARDVGASEMNQFSSMGTSETQFTTSNDPGQVPQIATDSSGDVYFPSGITTSVQVFDSAGVLQNTINCSGCPGGNFTDPSSVAVDSEGDVYVVDLGTGRVIKFTHSGDSYTFDSVLQSGRGAAAVGVDPSDNSVFIGDLSEAGEYHIVAYSSSGVQFDDFGGGLFSTPHYGSVGAGQIAVNSTTHKVYVSEPNSNALLVFDRVTINPPTVTSNPASTVGQLTATLNATVNANRHAVVDCQFEYVEDASFLVHGYESSAETPCSSLPTGSENRAVSATLVGLSPSTAYHYRVVAANNAGSVDGNSETFETLASLAPTVTTEGGSGISQKFATLAGTVNPHGGAVSDCYFEYGVNQSYGNSIPCATEVGPVTGDVTQRVTATGLFPVTTYHYRLVVTTNAGSVDGSDEEFTTLPLAPTVITEPSLGVTRTGATIAGVIDPNEGIANCRFEYGTTTSYGSTGVCPIDPVDGREAVVERLALTDLTPGTAYQYRLVGTNAGGTTRGSSVSFTTQSSPPSVVQTEPPQLAPPPTGVLPVKRLKCRSGFHRTMVHGRFKCVKQKHQMRRRRSRSTAQVAPMRGKQ